MNQADGWYLHPLESGDSHSPRLLTPNLRERL